MRNYYENTVIPSIVLACLLCLGWWWGAEEPILIGDIPLALAIFLIPMTVVDCGKKFVSWIKTLN
jgi:hypothetical protein